MDANHMLLGVISIVTLVVAFILVWNDEDVK